MPPPYQTPPPAAPQFEPTLIGLLSEIFSSSDISHFNPNKGQELVCMKIESCANGSILLSLYCVCKRITLLSQHEGEQGWLSSREILIEWIH